MIELRELRLVMNVAFVAYDWKAVFRVPDGRVFEAKGQLAAEALSDPEFPLMKYIMSLGQDVFRALEKEKVVA